MFDNNFNRVASGHQRVSSVLNAKHLITLSNINITQKGYVYVWVSNESNENKNTYFDDLKVTHTKGSILQEDHYYPFGMSIASLSNNSLLLKPNKFKYNGKELNEEFDLDWYDYGARNYDAQLGRFIQVDPAVDNYQSWTPYHYVMNNPIIFIDPTGMFTELFDENGNKIGEDENGNDGNVSIITNKDDVKRIKGNTKDGILATSKDVSSGVLTTKEVLNESVKVLEKAIGNGGLREESSIVTEDGTIIRGETGPEPGYEEISGRGGGKITVQTAEAGVPELPDGVNNRTATSIHSHPILIAEHNGQYFPQSASWPSTADRRTFVWYKTNVIVGAIDEVKAIQSNSDGSTRLPKRTLGAVLYQKDKDAAKLTKKAIEKIIN